MKNVRKFTPFSTILSQKVIKLTAWVFAVALLCVEMVGVSEVYMLALSNSRKSLTASRLEIEKSLKEIESVSQVMSMAVRDGNFEVSSLTSSLLEVDTNIVSCVIAYEPYAGEEPRKYFVASSYRNDGNIRTSVTSRNDINYSALEWYSKPKETGLPHWNEPSYEDGPVATTAYSVPLYDENDNFFGVMRLSVSLDLLDKVVNRFRPYPSAVTIVVSRAGVFMTHRDKYRVMNETIFTEAEASGRARRIEKCREVMAGGSGETVYPADGTLRHVQYESFYNGWAILGICSYLDFFKPINYIIWMLVIIMICGLIVQYIYINKKIKQLTKPIAVMTYSAMNMARGNFHASFPVVRTNDEIKKLEVSMRLLQTSINRYISELKNSTSLKERMESEMSVANNIQMSLLPREFQSQQEYDCYATLIPAKSVGGDLYDVRRDGNTLFFAVGDVSGKGVPAALYMALTKSAFNFVKNRKTEAINSRINDAFAESNEEGMFVTLFVAKIDLDTLEMEFCNGGHNPVIIIEPDGKARFLKCKTNIALGLFPGFEYESEKLQLSPGSRILAYTDGITEAENASKELFGDERLLNFAGNIPSDINSKQVITDLLSAVHEFTDGNEQNDDMTIFSVKFS